MNKFKEILKKTASLTMAGIIMAGPVISNADAIDNTNKEESIKAMESTEAIEINFDELTEEQIQEMIEQDIMKIDFVELPEFDIDLDKLSEDEIDFLKELGLYELISGEENLLEASIVADNDEFKAEIEDEISVEIHASEIDQAEIIKPEDFTEEQIDFLKEHNLYDFIFGASFTNLYNEEVSIKSDKSIPAKTVVEAKKK